MDAITGYSEPAQSRFRYNSQFPRATNHLSSASLGYSLGNPSGMYHIKTVLTALVMLYFILYIYFSTLEWFSQPRSVTVRSISRYGSVAVPINLAKSESSDKRTLNARCQHLRRSLYPRVLRKTQW